MNCNEIRELISCMLDQELSAQDSAIVGEHLADCPECMRVFEAFHMVSLSMEELEDVPDSFTEDVMNSIYAAAEAPKPKKKRGGILRIAALAGMAASFAIVMMAGTRFASTHKYVGDGSGDTAEYIQLQQTPKPVHHWYNFGNTPAPVAATPGDEVMDPAVTDGEEILDPEATPTDGLLDESVSPSPDVLDPDASPMLTPTPVPPMDLMFLEDLLIMDMEADYNLFSEYPAYEISVIDSNNKPVPLKVWTDGTRIYCKHEDSLTAWYTVGTAEQLIDLLGEPAATPTPEAPTPTVEPSPSPTIEVSPNPTPNVVSPAPTVEPTPVVTVSPAVTSVINTPEAPQPTPETVQPTPEPIKTTPEAIITTPSGILTTPQVTPAALQP